MKKTKAYSITAAAERLKVRRQAVHEAIKKGLLRAHWGEVIIKKKALLIDADSLESYRVSKRHQAAGKKND